MTPDELVQNFGSAIEARQAALLVGAGLSAGAGYPLWDDLISGAAAGVSVGRVPDYPAWAQYIEAAPGGASILLEQVVHRISGVRPEPQENHGLIARLPIDDVWTTNYDSLLEGAGQWDVIAQDDDLVLRSTGARRLYKMHGSIPFKATEPVGGRMQLVITRNDYERYAEQTHPRFWRLVQAQFLTSSFLFLGFSFEDPNFEDIFKMVRGAIGEGPLMQHYAVMRRPDDDAGVFASRVRDLESVGVRVVEIADYAEVTSILRRLVARSLPMRLLVSGSARTPAHPSWSGGTYPTESTPRDLDVLADSLGVSLAEAGVPGLMAAGEVGARVGYAYLAARDPYDPAAFLLLRRRSDGQDLTPPCRRIGEIRLADTEPGQLRDHAFRSVRCLLVLGGGQGTLDEVARARAAGMGVVPVAVTGGAALKIWQEMRSDLLCHEIGQQRVPADLFEQLATDRVSAIAAAVRLVEVGLFMR